MKKHENGTHARIRAENDGMEGYAGVKTPEVARRSGVPYSTLRAHYREPERMTLGELLAWMEVCGCTEFTVRRER